MEKKIENADDNKVFLVHEDGSKTELIMADLLNLVNGRENLKDPLENIVLKRVIGELKAKLETSKAVEVEPPDKQ